MTNVSMRVVGSKLVQVWYIAHEQSATIFQINPQKPKDYPWPTIFLIGWRTGKFLPKGEPVAVFRVFKKSEADAS